MGKINLSLAFCILHLHLFSVWSVCVFIGNGSHGIVICCQERHSAHPCVNLPSVSAMLQYQQSDWKCVALVVVDLKVMVTQRKLGSEMDFCRSTVILHIIFVWAFVFHTRLKLTKSILGYQLSGSWCQLAPEFVKNSSSVYSKALAGFWDISTLR